MTEERLDRKDFLRKGYKAVIKGILSAVEIKVEPFEEIDKRKQIRPPGAVGEREFLDRCNLCGKCWEVCPHNAIKQSGGDNAVDAYLPPMDWETDRDDKVKKVRNADLAEGYPVIIPEIAPCYLCDSPVCSEVCEEGALEPVEFSKIKIGTAKVANTSCFAHQKIDQNCDYCYDRCPLKDKAVLYENGPVIKDELCTGCGICEFFCVSNPKAIKIIPA